MELFYSVGACSLASHIALIEYGVAHSLVRVNLKTHMYNGADFLKITEKGAVPTLRSENGEILTENIAILQFIADQQPTKHLEPLAGTFSKYRLQESLSFISTEIHKGFGPFFDMTSSDEEKSKSKNQLKKAFRIINHTLSNNKYMSGKDCTVADFFLYVMLNWVKKFEVELPECTEFERYLNLINERNSVIEALKIESN